MLEVAMNELKKAATDFYNITGTKIVLFDENRRHLYSYPESHCSFCKSIRSVSALEKKCFLCDQIGFDECDKTRKPYIYKCHMNLTEAIAPIIENDIIIGYMMIGQIMNNSSFDSVKKEAEQVSKKFNLDSNALLSGLKEFRLVDNSFIYSAVNMASMCACYLYCNQIIKDRSDILAHQLQNYIESHISENLKLDSICKTLFISRSRLYKLSVDAFGMGITDYIKELRLEKAKKMLKETTKPIYQISDEVGFRDSNYFVRTFKTKTGMTPGKYRKNACN